ncbi:MAG: RDD family protein [Kineosporiaceae bacterium]
MTTAAGDDRRARGLLLRRIGALALDWAASLAVAALLPWDGPLLPLVVFAVVQVVLVGTVGHSLGHRLLGLHVQRAGGGDAGPVAALVRTALLVAVIPALVSGEDGRGLHDRAAGTEIVRFRDRARGR